MRNAILAVAVAAALVATGGWGFLAGRAYERSKPHKLTMVSAYSIIPGDKNFDIIWSTWLNPPYATKDGQCDRLRVESAGGENWFQMNVPMWLSEQLDRIESSLKSSHNEQLK